MNTPAHKKLRKAVIDFLCFQPFFGNLSLSLAFKEDPTCPTAWTDGRSIGYNPAFIESLTLEETKFLIAHEVMHCALGHPWRRDNREMRRWNVACDIPINETLQESKFSVIKGALLPDEDQKGKSAEWIYARLPNEPPQQGGGNGSGQGIPQPGSGKPQSGQDQNTPAQPGEVRDAPTGPDADGNPAPTEGEWKQRTAEAAQQAKMQGKLSAGMERLVEAALERKIDVRSLLLRFMTERTRSDYSWTQPNSRYISHGLYLPALHSVTMGEVAIMVDTSGSIDAVALADARRIVEDVISEVNPVRVSVWYADARVCHISRFEQGEPLIWEPKGGGGTDFRPALKAIEDEGTAVCVLCITDMYGSFPDGCSLPVMWLATTDVVGPFGETVPLSN